jgi:pseudouridine synthase
VTGDRLQKILARAGVASRRAAERLMADGRVTVNGAIVRELGSRANPDTDDIRVDGRPVRPVASHRYILLNKPRGFITSRSDPEGRRTVLDLLPAVRDYVYPVGRLDYDSEGLLILTNDGELAARLIHPRHHVEREYRVRVRGVPEPRALTRLSRGVIIDGRRTAQADVRIADVGRGEHGDQAVLSITVHEGRTHQVRRMCETIGHPVLRLRRIRIGPISDPTLKSGASRELSPTEVNRLKRAAGLSEPGVRALLPSTAAARPPRTRRAARRR